MAAILNMMTSSNGNIFRVTGPLIGEFTGLRWIPHTKGQWRGALMFSLIYAWTNAWVNNREAGDLRRYRVHFDVTVMRHFQTYCVNEDFNGVAEVYSRGSAITFGPRQNGSHFPDGIFKGIFWNENVWISIEISLKFVSRLINNITALVQIVAWCRSGDKPLSESTMA